MRLMSLAHQVILVNLVNLMIWVNLGDLMMCRILWIRLIPGESVDCGDTGEFDELGNSGKYGS